MFMIQLVVMFGVVFGVLCCVLRIITFYKSFLQTITLAPITFLSITFVSIMFVPSALPQGSQLSRRPLGAWLCILARREW